MRNVKQFHQYCESPRAQQHNVKGYGLRHEENNKMTHSTHSSVSSAAVRSTPMTANALEAADVNG